MVKLISDNKLRVRGYISKMSLASVCHVILARFKRCLADYCGLSKMFSAGTTLRPFGGEYVKHVCAVGLMIVRETKLWVFSLHALSP